MTPAPGDKKAEIEAETVNWASAEAPLLVLKKVERSEQEKREIIVEGRAASKSSLKIWLFSFCFPARSDCRYHAKFSCWKLVPQQNRRSKT